MITPSPDDIVRSWPEVGSPDPPMHLWCSCSGSGLWIIWLLLLLAGFVPLYRALDRALYRAIRRFRLWR